MLGVAKTPTKKGTTVTNKYQKTMPKTSTGPGLAVPGAVTIAMSEIAEDMLRLLG